MSNTNYYNKTLVAELFDELNKSFGDSDLEVFCLKYFYDVSEKFGDKQGKDQKLITLVKYCKENDQLEELKDAFIKERPEKTIKFNKFSPLKDTLTNRLYKHFLDIPDYREKLTEYFIYKKQGGVNSSILIIYGVSKNPYYQWFTKHVLKSSLIRDIDPIPPVIADTIMSDRLDRPASIAVNLIESILDKRINIYMHEEEKIAEKLSEVIRMTIAEKNLVLPYKIIEDELTLNSSYENFEEFIEKYWAKVLKDLDESIEFKKLQHSLVLLLLIEEKDGQSGEVLPKVRFTHSFQNIEFETYLKINQARNLGSNISFEIAKIDLNKIEPWVIGAQCFFKQNNYLHICDLWGESKDNFKTECGTMEGLFEKITQLVFKDLTFDELLKIQEK